MMRAAATAISDVILISASNFRDERGAFLETYKKRWLADAGVRNEFIQDNRSHSRLPGTVRGLHYQLPPFAQAKLVSVAWGRIYDVAVDLRRSSKDFGRHIGVELTAAGGEQLFIPAGFAHGFYTLEPDTVVSYKVDADYSPSHERGLHWRTPSIGIAWPGDPTHAVLSDKDAALPDRIDEAACFD